MAIYIIGLALLGLGYVYYGRLAVRPIRPDPNRKTPAYRLEDGVDFVPMPTWRVYLIQLLNIAGLGPVFGPILGALWGPQVFLWIIFGAILGGAVHDLLAGAMSMRNDGAGLPDLVGHYLGNGSRHFATAFILLLMILVGAVFVKGPAKLLAQLLPANKAAELTGLPLTNMFANESIWLWVIMAGIFLYYLIATLLPIDALIGRLYPIFSIALLVMVVGLGISILSGRLHMVHFTLANLHPKGADAWPTIFITVSCGAVSGFHSTQSPLMARCLKNEKHMRLVFYGAMIAEGIIALTWASAAQGFYGSPQALAAAIQKGTPSGVVHQICTATMGQFGGALAILGVVVLPITSGDTALRVARLIVADYLHIPQNKISKRYLVAIPIFAVTAALNFVNFRVIWGYFGWANQTLAAIALWTGTVFLARRNRRWWWLGGIPATFMTVITTTFILMKKDLLALPQIPATIGGVVTAAVILGIFLWRLPKLEPESDEPTVTPHPNETERQADNVAI